MNRDRDSYTHTDRRTDTVTDRDREGEMNKKNTKTWEDIGDYEAKKMRRKRGLNIKQEGEE